MYIWLLHFEMDKLQQKNVRRICCKISLKNGDLHAAMHIRCRHKSRMCVERRQSSIN